MTDAESLSADAVTARVAGVDLVAITVRAEVGRVLALVGAAADGAGALLAVLAGAARPRRGRARAFGADPSRGTPALAYIPLAPELPEGLRGRELVALAHRLRGAAVREPTVEQIHAFGVGPLQDRDTRRMSTAEARALLVFEALTSPAVRAVLVEEPLVNMTNEALSAVPRALHEATQHAAVVLATASPEDACALADTFAVLRSGRLVSVSQSLDFPATAGPGGVQIRVACGDARRLAAALVGLPEVSELRSEGGALLVRGPDAARLAAVVQRAIVASGVPVESLCMDALPLEVLQAAATTPARSPAP